MFGGLLGQDLALDPGTRSTMVYAPHGKIAFSEPSVVVLERETERVVASGRAAMRELERTPEELEAVWPLVDGVVANAELAEEMLRRLLRKAMRRIYGPLGRFAPKPRVLVCVPLGATKVELGAAREVVIAAGARDVRTLEGPLASAMGAGLSVGAEQGQMIVNIGSGRTEAAVISFGDIAVGTSVRIAGDAMDAAIRRWMREQLRLAIDTDEAERLKKGLGGALPSREEPPEPEMIRAPHALTGTPMMAVVRSEELCEALAVPVEAIVEAVRGTLERTSPDLLTDVADTGIVLCGGGALLRRLDEHLTRQIGVPVIVAGEPLRCAARGCGMFLEQPGFRHGNRLPDYTA